ncbi:MAG: preprotein translocase subunit SecA [Pseudomonadota bacterium]|nr:preprotein translocase subunit SecA [Pseudomonadota bacterium]
MLKYVLRGLLGSPNDRYLKKISKVVAAVNSHADEVNSLKDDEFPTKTQDIKQRIENGESLDSILPYAFALVREASLRTIGLRHYDVQIYGAVALHNGHISQMGTGEGKTLVATMPAYLNALSGHGSHIVTVNDYLAQRDSEWMRPVYEFLGLSTAHISSTTTQKSRQEAYAADVVYITNTEIVFDYLRDNMVVSAADKVQGRLNFVIVDEVDSVLIDNARTPVVISGSVTHDVNIYSAMHQVVLSLTPEVVENDGGDFKLDEKNKQAFLTETGHINAEKSLLKLGLLAPNSGLYDVENLSLIHYLMAALKANFLLHKDVDYVLKDGEVVIIDEHSGRAIPGRRWGDGIHQALESKEQLEIQNESQTLASITFQNFFRQYTKISGMTGTAETEAHEFEDVYGLSVVAIPANKKVIREDLADIVYLRKDKKYDAIIEDIISSYKSGQPVLVGTTSIENSELISTMLTKANIPHTVLNAKHHEQEAQIIANAGIKSAVTIATNMAGRGTDIVLGGNLDLDNIDDKAESERLSELWRQKNQEVKELGGLKIIGTERHESRRIDNQLRGRSGRQGDPGTTRFYLSLEDNLMRIFASEKVQEFMKKLGMKDDDTISAPMLTRSIENAQRKVEGHNYDIRKQLLEFDDIANDQRKVVFSQRNELLNISDISEVITDMRQTVVARTLDAYAPAEVLVEEWDISGIETVFKEDFGVTLDIRDWIKDGDDVNKDTLDEKVFKTLDKEYKIKESLVGVTEMQEFERKLMLQTMDIQWKEHLATMDHLRQGIHLRGYAQRNPVQEYKRESYEIFTTMLDNIKFEIIKKLQLVHIKEKVSAPHNDFFLQGDKTEIRRNDPCPCGSGLKYKHCHGKIIA